MNFIFKRLLLRFILFVPFIRTSVAVIRTLPLIYDSRYTGDTLDFKKCDMIMRNLISIDMRIPEDFVFDKLDGIFNINCAVHFDEDYIDNFKKYNNYISLKFFKKLYAVFSFMKWIGANQISKNIYKISESEVPGIFINVDKNDEVTIPLYFGKDLESSKHCVIFQRTGLFSNFLKAYKVPIKETVDTRFIIFGYQAIIFEMYRSIEIDLGKVQDISYENLENKFYDYTKTNLIVDDDIVRVKFQTSVNAEPIYLSQSILNRYFKFKNPPEYYSYNAQENNNKTQFSELRNVNQDLQKNQSETQIKPKIKKESNSLLKDKYLMKKVATGVIVAILALILFVGYLCIKEYNVRAVKV